MKSGFKLVERLNPNQLQRKVKSQMDSGKKSKYKKASLQKSNNKYQIDFDVYGEFAEENKEGSWFY
jgi:hypothetical protein